MNGGVCVGRAYAFGIRRAFGAPMPCAIRRARPCASALRTPTVMNTAASSRLRGYLRYAALCWRAYASHTARLSVGAYVDGLILF